MLAYHERIDCHKDVGILQEGELVACPQVGRREHEAVVVWQDLTSSLHLLHYAFNQ